MRPLHIDATISLYTFYSKHHAASKAVFLKNKSDYVNSRLKNLYCPKDKSLTRYFGSQSASNLFLPPHLLLFHLPCTLYSSHTYILTKPQRTLIPWSCYFLLLEYSPHLLFCLVKFFPPF